MHHRFLLGSTSTGGVGVVNIGMQTRDMEEFEVSIGKERGGGVDLAGCLRMK